jgi:hypothetical protein
MIIILKNDLEVYFFSLHSTIGMKILRGILGDDMYRYLRKNAKWMISDQYLGTISTIRYNYSTMHIYDYSNKFINEFAGFENYIDEYNKLISQKYNMYFYMRTYLYYYNFIIWYIWNYPFDISLQFINIIYTYYSATIHNKYIYALTDSIIVSINIAYIIAYILHINTNFDNIEIADINGLICTIIATYNIIDLDYHIYYFTKIYECDMIYKYVLCKNKYTKYIRRIKYALIRQVYRLKYNYSRYYLSDLGIKINADILYTLSYYLWNTVTISD